MLQTSRLEVYVIYGSVCTDRHFELSKCYRVYCLKKNWIITHVYVVKKVIIIIITKWILIGFKATNLFIVGDL